MTVDGSAKSWVYSQILSEIHLAISSSNDDQMTTEAVRNGQNKNTTKFLSKTEHSFRASMVLNHPRILRWQLAKNVRISFVSGSSAASPKTCFLLRPFPFPSAANFPVPSCLPMRSHGRRQIWPKQRKICGKTVNT